MNIVASADYPRAGCWRRWLANFIDAIIVNLPFQFLAAILFTATAGSIQMAGLFNSCAPARVIPEGLNPPPPHDSNFAVVCKSSTFSGPTSVTLTVAHIAQQAASTPAIVQRYMLDADGQPIHGTTVDWVTGLAFAAYIIGFVTKTGQTLGARLLSVRIVDAVEPSMFEIPLRKVVVRYLAMSIGCLPICVLLLFQKFGVGRDVGFVASADSIKWVWALLAVAIAWFVVLVVQIAMKRDPIYDALAGTAVLRD